MTPVNPITRRAMLGALSALAGVGLTHALPGAALAVSCPNACRSMVGANDAWIKGLPIIDAHCHIFNARDIPAIHFITKVFLPHYAPELSARNRRKLEAEIAKLAAGTLGYTPGFEQESAVLEARLAGESEHETLAGAGALPNFAHGSSRACFGADVADNISAVSNLVTILTRFRYQNFEALMATNELRVPDVGVALFTPSMIDMDYWLGFGGERESTISDTGTDAYSLRQSAPGEQILLTEMIQRLHSGRCHGFVSFCPWRQADDTHHNALVGEGSPRHRDTALDVLKDAILNRGFVGVKLYPPMGYLPLGNAAIPIDGFPATASTMPYAHEFGLQIDEALRSLYRFCVEQDVPIMAHTAPSNGAGVFKITKDKEIAYEERANPRGWARVLAEPGFETLKVNLAHFGHSPDKAKMQDWRSGIGQLMDDYPNVYTDLAHYPQMLMDNFTGTGQHCREGASILKPIRKEFLKSDAGEKRAQRMLYGSDWSMLSKEYYYADYLPVVAHMYRRKIYSVGAGAEQNARDFLSGNAIRFLGLRPGDKARARLEAWYSKHNLDPATLKRFDAVSE
jgi:predicted TIM-barrel fold metal-dependent hydrolase